MATDTKSTSGTEATDKSEATGTEAEHEQTDEQTSTESEDEETSTTDGSKEDPDDVSEKLDFWKRQARENEKELKRLRKIEEDRRNAELSETEKLAKERDDLRVTLDDLHRKVIATELGLSPELAERLKGSTEEELREDAERFAALVKPPKPKPTDVGIGSPGESGDAPIDPVELHRRAMKGRRL